MEHFNWGLPVAIDLFCAGLGAGAFMLAVAAQLANDKKYRAVSVAGAAIAPWPVILGVLLLVVDLGQPLRFWEMLVRKGPGFLMFSPTSTMSIGTWLLTIFVILSLAYLVLTLAALAFPGMAKLRAFVGIIGLPFALLVMVYTGVLLAASPNAVWNSPLLPVVFVISALATGVACVIFWLALIQLINKALDFPLPKLMKLDGGIVLFQLVALAGLIALGFKGALMPNIGVANLSALWWIGVVLLGLVVPVVVGLKGGAKPVVSLVMSTLVMLGGLVMRYIILIAGQQIV